MSARESVVLVGGGVSALAAAWDLTGGAEGPNRFTPRVEIVESRDVLGGSVQCDAFAGRDVDLGADGFLARRPEAAALARELGRDDDLVPIAASGAWLYLAGRLEPLPSGLVLGVPTSARSLRTLSGLSRRARRAAWRDEHFPHGLTVGEDASIGQIVRTKLGDEIALQVVEPMIGGIQAGRIDELSAATVFPALLEAARAGGSLMKALAPPPADPAVVETTNAPAFLTLRGGVGTLPRTLEDRLRERGVVLTTSTPVTALRRTPHNFYGWEVDTATTTTPANAVIVATPPRATATLLGALDPAFAALGAVRSAGAAMVLFSVPRAAVRLPESGTGVLVPLGTPGENGESLLVTAITFLDRKWPHLAAADTVLLRAHVGRSDDERAAALDDDALASRVARELARILGAFPSDGPGVERRVVRWPDALPQYAVGHATLVANARRAAASLGLSLAGNAYDGVGIPASVGSGRRAAREVRDILADR